MLIPGYPVSKETYFPKSERIIHHQTQAYDEKGNVILKDLPDEDRVAKVNSYKDEVGLRNILNQLLKAKDVQGIDALAYDGEKDAVDVTGVQGAHNLAELSTIVDAANAASLKALSDLNKALGTNITPEQFNQMIEENTLGDFLKNLSNKQEGGAE